MLSKREIKITLLNTQIKIRRKVFSRNVSIVFTNSHKQRAITDTAKELCDFIDKNSLPTESPRFIQDLMSNWKTNKA